MRTGNSCRNELGDRRTSVSLVVQENVLWEIWVMTLSPAKNNRMNGAQASPHAPLLGHEGTLQALDDMG